MMHAETRKILAPMRALAVRISLVLLLALGWATPSLAAFGETWTDSGSTTAFSASTAVNITISAASGDTICTVASVDTNNRTMTITDNKGGGSNTYTRLATLDEAGTPQEVWIDCTVSTGSVTQVTGTISSTIGGSSYLTAVVITGARATLGTANVTATTTLLDHSPGTLNTTDATGLFILVHRHGGGGTFTLDGAYTSRYSDTGYVIASDEVTTSSTPTSTTAANRTTLNLLAEIRPAAGGGGGGAAPRGLLLGVW